MFPELTYITLNSTNLLLADKFYDKVKSDPLFTHFNHTPPWQMLGQDWEVWMGILDDEVISWGQIQFFNGNKTHVCRLGYIVHPKCRNCGYGSTMLSKTIQRCKELNLHKAVATTRQDNHIMLNMFLKQGFRIEGQFIDEERIDNKYRTILSLAKFL